MESNNSVGKEVLEELIEYFKQQKRLQDDPMFIRSGTEAYDDAIEVCQNALKKAQPLSPQSAEGVEEKMLNILITEGRGHLFSLHERKIIFRAMTEYSSLMNKEKDREIEMRNKYYEDKIDMLNRVYSEKHNEATELQQTLKEKDEKIQEYKKDLVDQIESTRKVMVKNSQLQQLLSEKEKEMSELKERCIYWAKVYDENKKEIESLKQQKP